MIRRQLPSPAEPYLRQHASGVMSRNMAPCINEHETSPIRITRPTGTFPQLVDIARGIPEAPVVVLATMPIDAYPPRPIRKRGATAHSQRNTGQRGPQENPSGRIAALLLLAGLSTTLALAQPQTIWDGIYTGEQANRGRNFYVEICGFCHRDDLLGGGSEAGAPALQGSLFMTRWQDLPVVELFTTIGTTMPKHNPDSLRAQVVIDIVSFLLRENGVPAGNRELPPALEPLEVILFTDEP